MRSPRPARLAAIVLASTCAAASVPAYAALSVERGDTLTTASGSWAAVPALAGQAPGGGLTINWQSLGSNQRAFVDVVNTGSLDLTGVTMNVTTARNAGGGNAPFPTFTVEACVGASWVDATNSCGGTVTSLGAVSSGTMNVGIPIAAGARLSLRLSSNGNAGSGARFTTSVDVTVVRGQARAAQTVSS